MSRNTIFRPACLHLYTAVYVNLVSAIVDPKFSQLHNRSSENNGVYTIRSGSLSVRRRVPPALESALEGCGDDAMQASLVKRSSWCRTFVRCPPQARGWGPALKKTACRVAGNAVQQELQVTAIKQYRSQTVMNAMCGCSF